MAGGKEKRRDQTRKEKKAGRTKTEASVALTELEVTEAEVKGPKKAATGAERPRKAIMGAGKPKEIVTAGAGKPASLSPLIFLLPDFLSSSAFLLLSAFLASKRAFFRLLIDASCTSSLFLVFYSFSEDLLLYSCCPWYQL